MPLSSRHDRNTYLCPCGSSRRRYRFLHHASAAVSALESALLFQGAWKRWQRRSHSCRTASAHAADAASVSTTADSAVAAGGDGGIEGDAVAAAAFSPPKKRLGARLPVAREGRAAPGSLNARCSVALDTVVAANPSGPQPQRLCREAEIPDFAARLPAPASVPYTSSTSSVRRTRPWLLLLLLLLLSRAAGGVCRSAAATADSHAGDSQSAFPQRPDNAVARSEDRSSSSGSGSSGSSGGGGRTAWGRRERLRGSVRVGRSEGSPNRGSLLLLLSKLLRLLAPAVLLLLQMLMLMLRWTPHGELVGSTLVAAAAVAAVGGGEGLRGGRGAAARRVFIGMRARPVHAISIGCRRT